MPRAFKEAERSLIKSKLIAAGKRLINSAGVRLLVVDDVAREAGISKGSFYSFFPFPRGFHPVRPRVLGGGIPGSADTRGRLKAQGPARERIERFFMGTFEILSREPGLARLGMRDIQPILERLPPERIAAHQAADNKVLRASPGELGGRAACFLPISFPPSRGSLPPSSPWRCTGRTFRRAATNRRSG